MKKNENFYYQKMLKLPHSYKNWLLKKETTFETITLEETTFVDPVLTDYCITKLCLSLEISLDTN